MNEIKATHTETGKKMTLYCNGNFEYYKELVVYTTSKEKECVPIKGLDFVSGDRLTHYKGKEYQVLGALIENGEALIVYEALYGNNDIWVRPYYMFDETIVMSDTKLKRFTKIEVYQPYLEALAELPNNNKYAVINDSKFRVIRNLCFKNSIPTPIFTYIIGGIDFDFHEYYKEIIEPKIKFIPYRVGDIVSEGLVVVGFFVSISKSEVKVVVYDIKNGKLNEFKIFEKINNSLLVNCMFDSSTYTSKLMELNPILINDAVLYMHIEDDFDITMIPDQSRQIIDELYDKYDKSSSFMYRGKLYLFESVVYINDRESRILDSPGLLVTDMDNNYYAFIGGTLFILEGGLVEKEDSKNIILPNSKGDSRSANGVPTFEEFQLANSMHIQDVKSVMNDIALEVMQKGKNHDYTKKEYEMLFYKNMVESIEKKTDFTESEWYKLHLKKEKHHLNNRKCYLNHKCDFDLLDVIEMIVDIKCATLARGHVYGDINISDEILRDAFNTTCNKIMKSIDINPKVDVSIKEPKVIKTRYSKFLENNIIQWVDMTLRLKSKSISMRGAAKELGISAPTLYKYLKKYNNGDKL